MTICQHINNEGILQFEISHKKGQLPTFTCKNCNEIFSQTDVHAIIEGLL